MTNIIEDFEKRQIKKLTQKKSVPSFRTGDTIKVNVKVVEGDRSRIQVFEGICIARKNSGVNSSFTVRKISHGEGIERVFPLFSPIVDSIEVMRQGDVRRAKLYYIRDRSGKRARITDKDRGEEIDQFSQSEINEIPDDKIVSEVSAENKENVEDSSKEEKSNLEETEEVNDKKSDESLNPQKGNEPT